MGLWPPRPSRETRCSCVAGRICIASSNDFSEPAGLTFQELCHCLGSRADLELFVNAADIGVDRFVADPQFFRNFFVKKALAQAVKHFLLAFGKVFSGLRRWPGALK